MTTQTQTQRLAAELAKHPERCRVIVAELTRRIEETRAAEKLRKEAA